MTTYVEDDNGGMVTETCLFHCAPGAPAPCDGPDCQCGCHRSSEPWVDPDRAAELDNRDDDTLASIARDMETERAPRLDEMAAERHGDLRRLQAERIAPADAEEPTFSNPQPVNALTSEDVRIIAKNSSPYTGKPTTIHSAVHSISHMLSTGVLGGADLQKHTDVSSRDRRS